MKFCPGNEDEGYFHIQAARKGIFKDSTGKMLYSEIVVFQYLSHLLPYDSLCVVYAASAIFYCSLRPLYHVQEGFELNAFQEDEG